MAGKFAPLRGKVDAFQEESSYQEKVNSAKQKILESLNANINIDKLAALSVECESKKGGIESCEWKDGHSCGRCVYCLKIELRAISKMLVDVLMEQGIDNSKLASGGSVKIDDKPYPNVTKENRPTLMEWLIDKYPEMIIFEMKGMDKKQFAQVVKVAEAKGWAFSLDFNANSVNAMVGENILKNLADGKPISLPPGMTYFLDTQAKVKAIN